VVYRIEYDASARRQIRELPASRRGWVVDAIEQRLRHEPTRADRHRKRLRPNRVAEWELWVDPQRVLYDVIDEAQLVTIRVVGTKRGARLKADGQEIDLREEAED
jgi:mRNA-degrading endonuclease RelE of RelBE toxin-antitoxin system